MLTSSTGFSFCYKERLHLQSDFNRIIKNGKRITSSYVNIFVLVRNDGNTIRRVGLITSKKVGNATQRNLAKRRLREIFRINKHQLIPGLDIIFILKPAIKMIEYSELKNKVLASLKQINCYNDIEE